MFTLNMNTGLIQDMRRRGRERGDFLGSLLSACSVLICLLCTISPLSAQWQQVQGVQGAQLQWMSSDRDTIYAGFANAVVRRTADYGQHWEQVQWSIAERRIRDCLFFNGYIFAATERGLLRSADAGVHWDSLSASSASSAMMGKLFVQQGALYATSSDWSFSRFPRLIRSDDAGQSWTELTSENSSFDIQRFFAHSSAWFIGTPFNGLSRSTDQGKTWKRSGTEFFQHQNFIAIGCSPDSTTFYVVCSDSGVYCSIDSGRTWSSMNRGRAQSQCSAFCFGSQYMLLSSVDAMYRCAYSSQQWETIDSSLHTRERLRYRSSLSCFGDSVLLSTQRGLWCSSVHAQTWRSCADTFYDANIQQLYVDDSLMLVGTIYHELLRSTDKGSSWSIVGTIDNAHLSCVRMGTMLVAHWADSVHRSLDNGLHWTALRVIDTIESALNLHLLQQDSTNTLLLVTSKRVLHSLDSGSHWDTYPELSSAIGPILASDARKESATIYANSLYCTRDAGKSWISAELTHHTKLVGVYALQSGFIMAYTFAMQLMSESGLSVYDFSQGLNPTATHAQLWRADTTALLLSDHKLYYRHNSDREWHQRAQALPPSISISSVSCDNTNFYLASNNFGLWSCKRSALASTSTAVREMDERSSLSCEPQPCSSLLRLHFQVDVETRLTMRLTNLLGQELMVRELGRVSAGLNNYDVNLEELPEGLYTLSLQSLTGVWSCAIVIAR